MLTNKHVVVALIVAPILAILAWFAVDAMVAEQSQPALAGQSYPLVAKSNCRYASGVCELSNDEFSMTITVSDDGYVRATSLHSLDGVLLAIGDVADNPTPRLMLQSDGEGLRWALQADKAIGDTDRLLIVASRDGTEFFGDASTAFARPDDQQVPTFER